MPKLDTTVLVGLGPSVSTGSAWSFKTIVPGQWPDGTQSVAPYLVNNSGIVGDIAGIKHETLLYDSVSKRVYLIGCDYNAGVTQWNTAPSGRNWTQEAGGNTNRYIWSCDPAQPQIAWRLDQRMFMPDINGVVQEQGPSLGPDQVGWYMRTAGGRNEFWVLPGFYRFGSQKGIDASSWAPYGGEQGYAFKWLGGPSQGGAAAGNGWFRPTAQQVLIYYDEANPTNPDGTANVSYIPPPPTGRLIVNPNGGGVSTTRSDVPVKFFAYDPTTDTSFGFADCLEVVRYIHATDQWDHWPSGVVNTLIGKVDDLGRSLSQTPDGHTVSEFSICGSYAAQLGRRVYALSKWRYSSVDVRSYLVWVDCDTAQVGAITCPFDVDPNWPIQQTPNSGGNPEEHSFLVALNGKLVIAVYTYYGDAVAGTRPIWTFDPTKATGQQFVQGDPLPQWIGGNSMVTIPDLNQVWLLGSTANPSTPGRGWNQIAVYTIAPAQVQGGSRPTYTQTVQGPLYAQTEFRDHPADGNGGILICSWSSHAAYNDQEGPSSLDVNTLWRYDCVNDKLNVVYQGNHNTADWVCSDNFVCFYVPGYNWFMQVATAVIDLNSGMVLYGNMYGTKVNLGITPDGTEPPGMVAAQSATAACAYQLNGTLVSVSASSSMPNIQKYMSGHDWNAKNDVGISLGNQQGNHDVCTLFQKNPAYPGTPGASPFIVTAFLMPAASRHPDNPAGLGYPIRIENACKCRGDYLYGFVPTFQANNSTLDHTQRHNLAFRMHIPTVIAQTGVTAMINGSTPLPDSCWEWLPDVPLYPGGAANTSNTYGIGTTNGVTYDSARDRFYLWNTRVLEFNPNDNTYADVTPVGWAQVGGSDPAYDPLTNAHYISGGHTLASDGSAYPNYFDPNPTFFPSAGNYPSLDSVGGPAWQVLGKFQKCKF